MPVPMNVG